MKQWFTSTLVQGLVCLLLLCVHMVAAPIEDCPKEPGIWLGRNVTTGCARNCQQILTESLRRITGWQQLCFAENGALKIGEHTDFIGGSATARAVLFRALTSGAVFVIEDHSGSVTVNFGQLDEGLRYEDCFNGRRLLIWRVRLDFADFKRVDAPRQVREAFNEGFACLHELLHGLGHRDSQRPDEVGEVEEIVNQARAELSLPLRAQYLGETVPILQRVICVRLHFKDAPITSEVTGKGTRPRSYRLHFLPELGSAFQLAEQQTAAHAYWRR
jgi:hypothetical protein